MDGVELVMWPDTLKPEFFGVTDSADIAWMRQKLQQTPGNVTRRSCGCRMRL